ncbi:hypothetical protein KGF56_000186 [Candida oxycetoniae]|uniref:SET domain-containing protein n=1 Tax=Candida oxycetoniae TaxID=497107 RepID=A0AAI9X098_9ASCO|nr:uncharacterized protein KGF56_000186 [Candida oxycetoniae]KAI3406894.2 hypothetical protein KGF56_000186 [Candida oxycetoniae]
MDKIERLITWAKDHGAILTSNVEFKEISPNNYGSVSTSYDPVVIEIPRSLVITSDQAVSLFGKESFDKSTNRLALLKLYLSHSRIDESSFYKPYIDALPSLEAIDSPYTWPPEDRAYIQGTNLGNSLNENLASIIEEWWYALNLIPEGITKPTEHFINMKFYYEYKFYNDTDLYKYLNETATSNWTAFPNYLWSSLIFKSRAFPAYIIDKNFPKNEVMLLPVVDLLNHSPSAKVTWSSGGNEEFRFETDEPVAKGCEIFNNYGLKGNEELLLAYGFALEENNSDSVALKIKVPKSMIEKIEAKGIKLPTIDDYTNSVLDKEGKTESSHEHGILFFITLTNFPENLKQVFEMLVQNSWEKGLTLRMKLAGLNHLRAALEVKRKMLQLNVPADSTRRKYIKSYITSQDKILSSAITCIKRQEKELLSQFKTHLITLKNVYKKDKRFQQSLLFLGFNDFETILESEFQDQCWLLWLIRCYNKSSYTKEPEEDNYLPDWIQNLFRQLRRDTEITTQDVLNFKPIHDNLVPQLISSVPEIYGVGDWSIGEFVIAAKLLDRISFVRGKDQECIIVEQEYQT